MQMLKEISVDGENPTTDSKGASEPTSPTSPEEQLLHDHVKELNIPQDVALPYIQHVESRFTRRDEYEEQTKKCQRTQLGPEQPGEISSQILSQLLRKETLPWAGVANIHFAQVWRAAEIFVDEALDQCASGTVRAHIESTITSPKLKELKNQLDKRRNELLESHMIWNTGVTDSFVNLRMVEKRSKILTMRKIGRGVPEEDSNSSLQNFLLQKLLPRLVDCIKPDVSSRLGGPALVKTMEGIFREVSNDSTTLQIEDRTSDYDQFPLMGPYPPYHSNWSAASAVDHNETYYEVSYLSYSYCSLFFPRS